jgi:hypothetical protein
MRWEGLAVCMHEADKKCIQNFSQKIQNERHLADLGLRGRILLKWIIKKYGVRVWVRNESSYFTKVGSFWTSQPHINFSRKILHHGVTTARKMYFNNEVSVSRDLNPGPPKHETGALITQPRCLVG